MCTVPFGLSWEPFWCLSTLTSMNWHQHSWFLEILTFSKLSKQQHLWSIWSNLISFLLIKSNLEMFLMYVHMATSSYLPSYFMAMLAAYYIEKGAWKHLAKVAGKSFCISSGLPSLTFLTYFLYRLWSITNGSSRLQSVIWPSSFHLQWQITLTLFHQFCTQSSSWRIVWSLLLRWSLFSFIFLCLRKGTSWIHQRRKRMKITTITQQLLKQLLIVTMTVQQSLSWLERRDILSWNASSDSPLQFTWAIIYTSEPISSQKGTFFTTVSMST